MTQIKLAYGKSFLEGNLPGSIQPDYIQPKEIPQAQEPHQEVRDALECPLGVHLEKLISKTCTIAITINDKTRPVPHQILLPPLLEKIESLGASRENITFIVASGTHPPMEAGEYPSILPSSIIDNYSIISHNCDDEQNLLYLRETCRGTPITVNRSFYQADVKIVTGNIEPHHFMGFSGGVKSAAIGLSGRKTINHNHAMLTNPNSKMGLYETNPMRQDIEEIGKIIGVDYALNSVLNSNKGIAKVFSGDAVQVMRVGIAYVKEKCQVLIHEPYDIVAASAGGHPKDINLYQSQKSITHASVIAKDGGALIIVAACPEGSGSSSFEAFMEGLTSFPKVIEKFNSEGFQVGPHKAFQIAREASRTHIILVSSLPPNLVRSWLMTPAASLDEAFNVSFSLVRPNSRIAIMPQATNTIPVLFGGSPLD